MVIANPIYNEVFISLINNERATKFFIETLLNEKVIEIKYLPALKIKNISIYNATFLTNIQNEDGSNKRILTNIYKSRNKIDFMMDNRKLSDSNINKSEMASFRELLQVSIYLQNFKIPSVKNKYVNLKAGFDDFLLNKPLKHESIMVQIDRIEDDCDTALNQLLYLFKQENFIDELGLFKGLKEKIDHPEVLHIADMFCQIVVDPAKRKEMANEHEAWRTLYEWSKSIRNEYQTLITKFENTKRLVWENKKLLKETQQQINNNRKEKERLMKMIRDYEKMF